MDPVTGERRAPSREDDLWHRTVRIQLASLARQYEDLTTSQETMQESIDANTKAIKKIDVNTSELVDILNSWKGAFKVFDFIGKLAKPTAAIMGLVVAGAALWSQFKDHFK